MTCPICEYTKSMKGRSVQQLRLYWALLNLVCEHQNQPVFHGKCGVYNFHETVKVALGYVEPIYDYQGNVKSWKPSSIAFNKMDADQFAAFFDKVKVFIFGNIISASQERDFERRAYEMIKERCE